MSLSGVTPIVLDNRMKVKKIILCHFWILNLFGKGTNLHLRSTVNPHLQAFLPIFKASFLHNIVESFNYVFFNCTLKLNWAYV